MLDYICNLQLQILFLLHRRKHVCRDYPTATIQNGKKSYMKTIAVAYQDKSIKNQQLSQRNQQLFFILGNYSYDKSKTNQSI